MTDIDVGNWRRLFDVRLPAIVLGVFLCGGTAAASQQNRPKQVLVLYSVRATSQLAVIGNRDFPQILEAGLNAPVDYYAEYLDGARFLNSEYQRAFRDFLRLKYRDGQLDVIIATSSAVLDFIAADRGEFFPETPVVFYSGRSSLPRPIANSTGLASELRLDRTLDLATALDPALRHVYVISASNDGFEASESLARRQFRSFESRLTIAYWSGLSSADLESRLARLPEHSMVFYFGMNRDALEGFLNPVDYLNRVVAVANAPTYSWVDSVMGRGVVGGVMKDQNATTRELAKLALRVLHGESAARIPVADVDLNVAQVDWRQLQRWHIDEARVPVKTVIRFREPGVWNRYRSYVLGAAFALLAEAALIGLLLVQRLRRREAEAAVLAGYERIRDLASRLLKAQESERRRIAGELHDNFGQQLALVAIGLDRMRTSASGADSRALIERASQQVLNLSRELHDLSYRLHPVVLHQVGLVAALRRLVNEASHPDLVIAFAHHGVPSSMPGDVILCVFRIAQEALQNVIRHSGARRVSIELEGTDTEVRLKMQDNGRGFDLDSARNNGLGLISMTERVESLGGRITVVTHHGAGTRLSIVLPLRHDARPDRLLADPASSRAVVRSRI